jgi:hypothetical protein
MDLEETTSLSDGSTQSRWGNLAALRRQRLVSVVWNDSSGGEICPERDERLLTLGELFADAA